MTDNRLCIHVMLPLSFQVPPTAKPDLIILNFPRHSVGSSINHKHTGVLKIKMKIHVSESIAIFIIATQFSYGLTMPTVPAFLWSPHQDGFSSNGMKEVINYQTISQKELAKSVLSEGGWSNLLCSGENLQQPMDLALVFVGRELQSSDISGNKHADPALVDLLKASFTRSNFSMAFPYVAASEEEKMENSLMSGFSETCGHKIGVRNVAFLESCSLEGADFKKLADLQAVHEFLNSRMEKRPNGQADLVVVCNDGSNSLNELDQPQSESKIFSELISSVEQSGAKYAVLYVSDPVRSIKYPSYRELERFLAESGNGSANSTFCDEVCKAKSALLEGLFVGLVLLIILISGLCCMMGIDTPTRFETPQES